VKAAEAELKDVKKALPICRVNNRNIKDENEKLVEMVDKLKVENQSVTSGTCVIENELKDVKKELTRFHNMENKYKKTHDENKILRATLANVKESLEESGRETFQEQIKLKDDEIKNLNITRKLSADNEIKLRRINLQLEKEMKDLKSQSIGSSNQTQLPYPCDKCEATFKTAGLLIRHVKSEHQNLPVTRA
jgi:chromosome segregation ATPase